MAAEKWQYTPEYVLSMGWTLLQNMLTESSSMNNTEDEPKGKEIKIGKGQTLEL